MSDTVKDYYDDKLQKKLDKYIKVENMVNLSLL